MKMVIVNHSLLLLIATTSSSLTKSIVEAFAPFQPSSTSTATTSMTRNSPSTHDIITSSSTLAPLFYNDKNSNAHDNKPSSSWWLPGEWMQPDSTSSNTVGRSSVKQQQERVNDHKNAVCQRPSSPFAQGKELQDLRSDIIQMKQNLQLSLATDDLMRVVALTKSLEEAEKRDPEYVYTKALKMIAGAGKYNTKKKYQILTRYNKEAKVARSYIARLNMGGLWVANFGQGSELVNVTYSGDTMIATRLSAPEHFLFQADLSPMDIRSGDAQFAPPIPMDKSAVTKWGIDKLERYPGKAMHTHKSKTATTSKEINLVDGNLIMFDGYFSFLWIPTRQHVFFSRPKPELVLKLLRDVISEKDEIENMRHHLTKCFKKGIEEAFIRPEVVQDGFVEPFRRISRESDLLAAQEEIQIVYETKEENSSINNKSNNNSKLSSFPGSKPHQSFWDFHKWLHYIDKAMKPNEMENN